MNMILPYSWWGIVSACLIMFAFARLIWLASIGADMDAMSYFAPSFWIAGAGVICYAVDRAVGGDWDDLIP